MRGGPVTPILNCTEMKDTEAEEPKRQAYDLQPVKLFTDEEGEKIHSLAVREMVRGMVCDSSLVRYECLVRKTRLNLRFMPEVVFSAISL